MPYINLAVALGALDQLCSHFLGPLLSNEHGYMEMAPLIEECIKFLDPEMLDLTRNARDNITPLSTYNLIAANRALWESLAEQAPNLMPLIGHACRKNFIRLDNNVFRSLKQYGKLRGLTETGRKTLCKFSGEQIRMLAQLSLPVCFRLASHYGDAGHVPSIALMTAHINHCRVRNLPLPSIPAWFDAAAICEYEQQEKVLTFPPAGFVRNEYMIALDWLNHYVAEGGEPDKNQKKAGWQWIMNQSEAWHEAQREELARQRITTNHTWNSALGTYQDDGYEVVP